jgi:hypothetical protein
MGKGSQLELALVDLAIAIVVLGTESVATAVGLIALRMKRPFGDIALVRGVTWALVVINYALAQGAFGFYLHRTGVKPLVATGATLFLIGTNLVALLGITTLSWAVGDTAHTGAIWWTLVGGCAGFLVYLVAIASAPGALVRRELFEPLFTAGLRGHAFAIAGRLPHTIVIVLGQWLAIRAWGIPVPFSSCATIMPLVVIAAVLPISPAGLGTTQAAFLYFFVDLAPEATADGRTANLLAFGISHLVYGVGASLLIGLLCLPVARRRGLFARPA